MNKNNIKKQIFEEHLIWQHYNLVTLGGVKNG